MENNKLEMGDHFSCTFSFTQQQVNDFALISGDNNPIHLDEDFASKTIFKRPIIHGFLGGSIFSKVLGTDFPGEGTIYLMQNMSFRKPMFVNEVYKAEFLITDVDHLKHKATIETTVLNSMNEQTIIGNAIVLNEMKF